MSVRNARRADRRHRRKQSKTWCRVYVLREFAGGPARYVGQTRQSPEMRLWWHLKDLRKCKAEGRQLTAAKRRLDGLSAPPIIEVLDEHGIWDISEAVWIDRLRRDGAPLLNVASVIA